MKIEFRSKVFTGTERTDRLYRALFLLAGGTVLLILIIKILASDLRMADFGGILFSVFLIWRGNTGGKTVPQYAYADGEIEFGEDRIAIRYRNAASKGADFDKETVLPYREIVSIEYGGALCCYRFVTKGGRKKDRTETFMYVLDEEEERTIRGSLNRYTGLPVRVMEDGIDS